MRCRLCHKKFKHTNEVYGANEPNFLGPIFYGTQQVEPQFLMAYQVHSYERASTCSEWYSSSAHVVGIQGEMMSLLAVFFFQERLFCADYRDCRYSQ